MDESRIPDPTKEQYQSKFNSQTQYQNRNWKGLKDISVDLDENTKRKRQPQLELKKPIFREYLTSREDKTEKMATLEWSESPIHIKEEGSIFNKINSNVLRMPSNKTLREWQRERRSTEFNEKN